MKDLPGLILIFCVWGYWTAVVGLAVASHLRFHQSSGLWPRSRHERLLWTIWIPVVLAWNLLPWLSLRSHDPFFRLPTWSTALGFFWEVRLAAAILAIVCCLATGTCWARMGRSWSVGIVPEEKRELLCSGPFAVVRHPIYALSICLMVMTVCVAPTFAVAIMALLHVILMHVKARGEEAFLSAVHGQAYLDYCRQTGRFFPRQFFNRRQIETQM